MNTNVTNIIFRIEDTDVGGFLRKMVEAGITICPEFSPVIETKERGDIPELTSAQMRIYGNMHKGIVYRTVELGRIGKMLAGTAGFHLRSLVRLKLVKHPKRGQWVKV